MLQRLAEERKLCSYLDEVSTEKDDCGQVLLMNTHGHFLNQIKANQSNFSYVLKNTL
jgi:hypothetical protein